jgi:hypothetical protein
MAIYEATLRPAGFREWQRGELVKLDGAEDWGDWESACLYPFERADNLTGAIQGEVVISDTPGELESRIYKIIGATPNEDAYCIVYQGAA